jgi:LmbE family N-acetylglucosaminyl deacetylase
MITEDQLIPFHSTDPTGKRVLVLAPHPDDETIGCGGTLALHAAAGDPVRVIILTNGAKGDMSGRFSREDYIALRRRETMAACACLGITDVMFLDHEDRELANVPTLASDVAALIDAFTPDVIYAPSPLEFHPDHRAAADAAERAVRLCKTPAELLYYEVGQPVQIDVLVDITGVLDKKHRAILQYQSQLDERPYNDVALALNRFRSLTLSRDVTHAEGFVTESHFRKVSFPSVSDVEPDPEKKATGTVSTDTPRLFWEQKIWAALKRWMKTSG